jgi:hypothetical protein
LRGLAFPPEGSGFGLSFHADTEVALQLRGSAGFTPASQLGIAMMQSARTKWVGKEHAARCNSAGGEEIEFTRREGRVSTQLLAFRS